MKIPDKLKIGPHEFKVEIVKEGTLGSDAWGYIVPGELKIQMSESCFNSLGEVVFLHEIIHAAEWLGGLNLSEKFVKILSHMLLMIIKDNNLDFRDNKTGKKKNATTSDSKTS